MAQLTGVVRDAAGHEARNDVSVTISTGAPASWGPGILRWIEPMPLSVGATFYASPSGSDTNPGTAALPWRSLTKANTLKPGQTLQLGAGDYGARGATFDWTADGDPANPISIIGAPGPRPNILGRVMMRGGGQRWSRSFFKGPTGPVGGPGPNGEAILLNLFGSDLEVSGCEVAYDQWHAGIGANDTARYRILDCYIHDNGGLNGDFRTSDPQWNTSHGCYISPSSFGLIANCLVEHNDAKGIMGRHDSHHILIVHNTIVANGRHGSESYESTHDWVWANNILLRNGTVKGGVGISAGGSGGNTYLQRRNVYWKNGTSGSSNWSGSGIVSEPVVADPKLTNPAVYSDFQDPAPHWDHHPLAGSPAIGYADPLYAMPFDIDGRARGVAPDCGAYQAA